MGAQDTLHHGDPTAEFTVGPLALRAQAHAPEGAAGWVAFVHAGSHRSAALLQLAALLQMRGLGTLLPELLRPQEAAARRSASDIDLLAARVEQALDWIEALQGGAARPVGLLGAGSGGAAALKVAAAWPQRVAAVVLCAVRVDLAGARLQAVLAPTLLLAGGLDTEGLRLNREALLCLGGERRLEVLPGATQRFDEPGVLETVGHLAADWFTHHGLAEAE